MPFDAPTQPPQTIVAIVPVDSAAIMALDYGWTIREPLRAEVDSRTVERRFDSSIKMRLWLSSFATGRIRAWVE